jgi:hypothetical protein
MQTSQHLSPRHRQLRERAVGSAFLVARSASLNRVRKTFPCETTTDIDLRAGFNARLVAVVDRLTDARAVNRGIPTAAHCETGGAGTTNAGAVADEGLLFGLPVGDVLLHAWSSGQMVGWLLPALVAEPKSARPRWCPSAIRPRRAC